MQVFNNPSTIIITCNQRLSPYLQAEVERLGYTVKRVFATGLELEGSVNDCIKLNLNLFCASQILYRIKHFVAYHADDLYHQTKSIPWEELIDFNGYFSVTSNVNNDTIQTPLFANLKVKDAIVDRIKEKKGVRPNSGPELNRAVVHLYWQNEQVDLYIDTSGETLAKHRYRKNPGQAPMLEALASAVLFATNWDRESTFINPMCGSGTLAIEAALLATDRRPGLFRMNYGFMHIQGFDEQVFSSERKRLKSQINRNQPLHIIASDISPKAVEVAKANAKTAGIDGLIDFEVCDFAETTVPTLPGIVIFNPEYGERLGNEQDLEHTYRRIGDFLKQRCKGYRGFVFTANPALAKKIGLKASAKIPFYNGKLDSRMFCYDLYEGSKRKEQSNNTNNQE